MMKTSIHSSPGSDLIEKRQADINYSFRSNNNIRYLKKRMEEVKGSLLEMNSETRCFLDDKLLYPG